MESYLVGISAAPSHWALLPLSVILRNQDSIDVSVDARPILAWEASDRSIVESRIKRLSMAAGPKSKADLAGFLLPYIETALQDYPNLKVIHVSLNDISKVEAEYGRRPSTVCNSQRR